MMDAVVVRKLTHLNGCTTTLSQMRHARSIQQEVGIMETSVPILLVAKIAIHTKIAMFLIDIWFIKLTSILNSKVRMQ